MDLSDAIRLKINNLIKENNINASTLSSLAGISRSTLSKFLSGERNLIRLDMIALICKALHITLGDFFNDDLFKDIDIKQITK